jgi:hypothetical protein
MKCIWGVRMALLPMASGTTSSSLEAADATHLATAAALFAHRPVYSLRDYRSKKNGDA